MSDRAQGGFPSATGVIIVLVAIAGLVGYGMLDTGPHEVQFENACQDKLGEQWSYTGHSHEIHPSGNHLVKCRASTGVISYESVWIIVEGEP